MKVAIILVISLLFIQSIVGLEKKVASKKYKKSGLRKIRKTIEKNMHQKIQKLSKHFQIVDEEQCDMMKFDHYDVCKKVLSCSACTLTPHCGWCDSVNQCMPGGNKGSICPNGPDHCNDKNWNFAPQMCAKVDSRKNSVTGRLTEERKQESEKYHQELSDKRLLISKMTSNLIQQ